MDTLTLEQILKIIFSPDAIIPLLAILFGYFAEVRRAKEEHLRSEEENQSKEKIAEDALRASMDAQTVPQTKLIVEASEDVVSLMRSLMADQNEINTKKIESIRKENISKLLELNDKLNALQAEIDAVSLDRDQWKEEALSWESKYSSLKAESERQADEITTLKNKVRELEEK